MSSISGRKRVGLVRVFLLASASVVAVKGVVAAKGAQEVAGAKGREVLEAGTADRPAEAGQH